MSLDTEMDLTVQEKEELILLDSNVGLLKLQFSDLALESDMLQDRMRELEVKRNSLRSRIMESNQKFLDRVGLALKMRDKEDPGLLERSNWTFDSAKFKFVPTSK